MQAAGVVDELAALSEKGCRIERLLVLLVRAAVQLLPTQPHYEQLLQTMLTNVQMGEYVVKQQLLASPPGRHKSLGSLQGTMGGVS